MGNSASKSNFRESVYALNSGTISSSDTTFWNKLFSTKTSAEEIFTLIQANDVRVLRQSQPENLKTLIQQAVFQLQQIVSTPYLKYYTQALNAVRLLTRILPCVLEIQDDWLDMVFWGMEQEKDEEKNEKNEKEAPLGQRLIQTIMGLLFLPEFTVSSSAYLAYEETRDASTTPSSSTPSSTPTTNLPSLAIPVLLWSPGIAYSDVEFTSSSAKLNRNRKEILKLFLTCFSQVLYVSPSDYKNAPINRFLTIATSSTYCPLLPTLFYSLLNTCLSYDPIGYGIPYANALFEDEALQLVDISLQNLLVLLDFGISSDKTTSSSNMLNEYRTLLTNITREEDLSFLYTGILKLLTNCYQASSTYLPQSMKPIECHQELLVLLWKCLEDNIHFREYCVVEQKRACDLIFPILFLMCQGRLDPTKVGLIHICTFILLLLSGGREFAVALNAPLLKRLPIADLPPLSNANYADLLIVVLHKVIVNGYEKLNSVYNCFLTISSNISPYVKTFHMAAAVRLVRLFKLFSQPKYVVENAANHHLVFFLLDTFNNIVQYQYEGNHALVYAILESKELFYQLHALSLPNKEEERNNDTNGVSSINEVTLPKTKETTDTLRQEPAMLPRSLSPRPAAGFRPTSLWLSGWKKKLPLQTMLRLLHHLSPQVDKLCSATGSIDEYAMMEFLKNSIMVGLLPVPHAIVIRKYQTNEFTTLWFTTFSWGVIFLRNQTLALFDGKCITLFAINIKGETTTT